jgi:hypothetical protein
MDKNTHKNESDADACRLVAGDSSQSTTSLRACLPETVTGSGPAFESHFWPQKISRQAKDFSWRGYWDDFRTPKYKVREL